MFLFFGILPGYSFKKVLWKKIFSRDVNPSVKSSGNELCEKEAKIGIKWEKDLALTSENWVRRRRRLTFSSFYLST